MSLGSDRPFHRFSLHCLSWSSNVHSSQLRICTHRWKWNHRLCTTPFRRRHRILSAGQQRLLRARYLSVLHSTVPYFLISQVQGFLIFFGICSKILSPHAAYLFWCLIFLEQWLSWWGKQKTGDCPRNLSLESRDRSPCCIWKLESFSWIHFPSLWTIYNHMLADRWKKIILLYNLEVKGKRDHYWFPSLNTHEVSRVLMKASVWCWVWPEMQTVKKYFGKIQRKPCFRFGFKPKCLQISFIVRSLRGLQ